MTLRTLLEEFDKMAKSGKDTFSIYVNPSKEDYAKVIKENRKFAREEPSYKTLSKENLSDLINEVKFVIDLEKKKVYISNSYIVHNDIFKSLGASEEDLKVIKELFTYGIIKDGNIIHITGEMPIWAKKYL